MRTIDERAIRAHADLRFRSEYDYALFKDPTGTRRSSHSWSVRASGSSGASWMPAAAAAGCRCRWPKRRDRSWGMESDRIHGQGVIVFGTKAEVGVRPDGALVNRAHAPSCCRRGAVDRRTCR